MSIEVIEPGMVTTVQDRGRPGYYGIGIPEGGALDRYSYELANSLVGNAEGEAALECSYLGPTLRVEHATSVAIGGAPVEVKVNDELRSMWERIDLKAGDLLSFGPVTGGIRYYVAVAGGIDVPEVLGSRSTYLVGNLGGLQGRKLEKGDQLPLGPSQPLPALDVVPEELRPSFERNQEVRFTLGPYDHRLTEEGLHNLLNAEWKLTPVADRIGMRYDGPGVTWRDRVQPFGAGSDPSNIVDAGYSVGAIQIPGGTQPIILHREAVSLGGYASVGVVITADMDLLARAAPGTCTRFVPVTVDEAVEARRVAHERAEAARNTVLHG